MFSTESPLKDLLAELDVDSEHAPSSGGHQQKPERLHRSSGKDHPARSDRPSGSDKPPMSKRLARGAALFLFAVLVGVGGTLASQSYRDEIVEVFPLFGFLSPASTLQAPVPAATAEDLQEQLKPLAGDLSLVRRGMEQLTFNLDQLARKEDQLSQNVAALQAAEQEVTQTVSAAPPPPKTVSAAPPPPKTGSAPPPPKVVHVPLPPPKSLQPSAQ